MLLGRAAATLTAGAVGLRLVADPRPLLAALAVVAVTTAAGLAVLSRHPHVVRHPVPVLAADTAAVLGGEDGHRVAHDVRVARQHGEPGQGGAGDDGQGREERAGVGDEAEPDGAGGQRGGGPGEQHRTSQGGRCHDPVDMLPHGRDSTPDRSGT